MRSEHLGVFPGVTALALAVQPAEAAWHSYFFKQGVGFSFSPRRARSKARKTTLHEHP